MMIVVDGIAVGNHSDGRFAAWYNAQMDAFRRRAAVFVIGLAVVSVSFGGLTALATEQERDRLVYGGREYAIFQVPMLGLWYYGEGEPPKGKSAHRFLKLARPRTTSDIGQRGRFETASYGYEAFAVG